MLSVLFLTVYTYGKCKEEAEVFKMLRAIGMPVYDIRLMVYLEVLVRMVISIINGVLLGLVFSLGLAGNVEEVLMLKAPLPSLNIVIGIAAVLLVVFSATVIKSTAYLTKRTVLQTAKMWSNELLNNNQTIHWVNLYITDSFDNTELFCVIRQFFHLFNLSISKFKSYHLSNIWQVSKI